MKLCEICEINPRKTNQLTDDFEVSFVSMSDVNSHDYYFSPKQVKLFNEVSKGYTYFEEGDVLLAKITPCFENGKSAIARDLRNGIGFGSTEFIVLRANNKTTAEWIFNFVSNPAFINDGRKHMTGSAGQKRLSIDFLRDYMIPLPPLEIQKKLVEEAEKEQQAINVNRHLIGTMQNKISVFITETLG